MAKTKIEWATDVWNPIRGCSRVSEGCRRCYAERMAARFNKPGMWGEGLAIIKNGEAHWTGKIDFDEEKLLEPLHWKRPRLVFVNSVSDLFHENVQYEWIDKIFSIMALCPNHKFLLLTKRPKRMLEYLTKLREEGPSSGYIALAYGRPARFFPKAWKTLPLNNEGLMPWPLPNVRLGTSVENQTAADERLDYLCELGSQRWNTMVSFEPLLSDVDPGPRWLSLGTKTWAIVGGESGHGARPMQAEWARNLRDECKDAGIPFFFKQWGEWVPTTDLSVARERGIPPEQCMNYVGKKAAGNVLDGEKWEQYPQ